MSNIRCIVIEDEPLATKILSAYIARVPFLELKESFKNALQALDFLRTHKVDLIFLDIHLPQLKGMDFLKSLSDPPAVIVTTAYHQYAVEGFELNVTDYLLKPFAFERFLVAVNKVMKSSPDLKNAEKDARKGSLYLNVQKRKVKVMMDDILYIESQREYVKVVTSKNQYTSKIGTNEIEALLPSGAFLRIHRSYIVSIDKIGSFTNEMVEINGIEIPVGREYKDNIRKL